MFSECWEDILISTSKFRRNISHVIFSQPYGLIIFADTVIVSVRRWKCLCIDLVRTC